MKKLINIKIIEFLFILVILSGAFLIELKDTWFHPDESMWINQSSHFEDFFRGRFARIAQGREDLALQMPTIPEFTIGLSRRLGGYDPSELNKMWDWGKSYEVNAAIGSIPSENMIWWSRFLPAILGIASIIITFYILKVSFGISVGYIWLVLTLVNDWLINALQRAMSESPILFCIVIAMLAGYLAIKSFNPDRKSMIYSLLWLRIFAIFTGLAGESKLNGLAIFLSGIAILLFLTNRCNREMRWKFFIIGLLGISILTFLFFVGTNPFLWSDPIGKTLQTFNYRVHLLKDLQPSSFPQMAVHGWQDQIRVDFEQIFRNLTSIHFLNSDYLKFLLTLLGISAFIATVLPSFDKKNSLRINAAALSILFVGFFASLPNFFSPLNLDRYFLLPVFFVSIMIAIGIDWLLKYIGRQESIKKVVQVTDVKKS